MSRVTTIDDITSHYHDIFDGDLGTFKEAQHLEVDPDVPPRAQPDRQVPIAMKPKPEAELKRLFLES